MCRLSSRGTAAGRGKSGYLEQAAALYKESCAADKNSKINHLKGTLLASMLAGTSSLGDGDFDKQGSDPDAFITKADACTCFTGVPTVCPVNTTSTRVGVWAQLDSYLQVQKYRRVECTL